MRDVQVSYKVFGAAIRVDLTYSSYSPSFVPGISNGKLTIKVGKSPGCGSLVVAMAPSG